MNIKYYENCDCISEDWKYIFSNSSSSYFCSLQWHKVVLELYKSTFITKRLNSLRYFIATSKEDSEKKVLGFFYLRTQKKGKMINFSHLLGPSDYYNFICTEKVTPVFVSEIINKICRDFDVITMNFGHVQKESELAQVFQGFTSHQIRALDCVAISLPNIYDVYFSSLSKSVRQNIRTAYNRLKKKELEFDFQISTSSDLHMINFNELKRLYEKRNAHRKEKLHWKTCIFKKLNHPFTKEKDMFELKSLYETEFTLGVLRIKGRIVAYFFGFEKNHKIEINRVVIDNEYRFYSPGLILLNEFIKQAIPKRLGVLDLTVGNEKYKYDLGGTTHEILNAKINL